MFEILGASVLIMLASLVGVISVWKGLGRVIEKNLHFLVSFSAGVFAVIVFYLASEAVERGGLTVGLGSILAGVLFISILFKILPTLHRHHDHPHEEHHEDEHMEIDPRRVLVSDSIHNIGDGILLAASFAAGPVVGIATAFSVFVHEILQEISEFFILRDGGYDTRKALAFNFLSSSTILVGAVGGYFALDFFEVLEAPLIGFGAGAFLVVVLGDLIPHSVRHSVKTSHHLKHLIWFVIGGLLMFWLSNTLSHAHAEEEDGYDHNFTYVEEVKIL